MYKNLFGKRFREGLHERRPRLLLLANNLLFFLSLAGLAVFLFDIGFAHDPEAKEILVGFYGFYAIFIFLILTLRLFLINRLHVQKGWFVVEYLVILLLVIGMVVNFFSEQLHLTDTFFTRYIRQNFFTFGVIFYVFLIELSKRTMNLYRMRFNPALLFVASFILLIFIGTGLLLMPRATTAGISVLDALFTSASAVCVTGLIVLDTATDFTIFGQTIILILIQLGGLGIMTFTSFLAMFFLRSSTFQNQLFMKDLVNEENIGQTMHTIGNIVRITFLIELVGAVFIFFTISPTPFAGMRERIGFSVFHSISAFCNAGFSTRSDGLYDVHFRYDYDFQLVIITLILIGGIGFPILFNTYRYLRQVSRGRLRQLTLQEEYVHTSRVISIHTKIVLLTTAALLAAGFAVYFLTEYNSTLADRTAFGKIVTSLFGSVTPRTAGFNTVDMTELTRPLVLVYLLLMWIGASPGSTGGGIKTTTFALAILNTFSIAKGKDRVEAFSREIASKSVRQAFAVMLLSFLVIGLATLFISYFDPEKQLIQVAFEAFSAYSTVGLSLGITGDLSSGSKVVVIFTMFLGRVGTFTLIAGMVTKISSLHYRYPQESIIVAYGFAKLEIRN
ncbi:potassium transporter TrkG [soil metagenome]